MPQRLQARVDALSAELQLLKKELARSRQEEHGLRKETLQIRTIFDDAAVGLARLDQHGKFLAANPAFCRLVGLSRDELLSRTALDVTHPEDCAIAAKYHAQSLAPETPATHYEKRFIRKGGATVWASVSLAATRDEGREPGITMVAKDITRHKAMHESLRRIACDLSKMDTELPIGSWEWNIKTGMVTLSDEALQFFALQKENSAIPISALVERVHPDDRERVGQAVDEFSRSQKPYRVECRLLRPDGSERLIVSTGEVYRRDAEGNTAVMIGMLQDVTLRRQAEAALQESEARFRTLFNEASDGIFIANRDGEYTDVNVSACRILGYTREELIGSRIADLIRAEDLQRLVDARNYFLQNEDSSQISEWQLRHKDGSYLDTEINARFLPDGRWMAIVRDISERKRTQAALEKQAAELRQAAAVFEHTAEAIVIADNTCSIVAVNKAFTEITGYRQEEVIGKNLLAMKTESDDSNSYRNMCAHLEEAGNWQGELWDRKKSGEVYPVWQNISTVRNAAGEVTEYIAVFSDITSIKKTEQRLIELAYHDALTRLPNRLLFNDRLGQAIERAKRHKTSVGLLLLDLDRFKLINDTLGHAAGDELLQVVASRLNDSVRGEDTIARLGGDEFAVVIDQLDTIDDAALLAEKLVRTIGEPIVIDGQSLSISASIGISVYPDDAGDKESLSKAADVAMYGAKDGGRNSYAFYTPAMTDRAAEVFRIDHGLRNAILRNELVLYFQPQLSLDTGRIVGVEVLLRWNHPEHGLQGPDRFIPVAEETHLIESVGDWVIDNTLRQMERWTAAGIPPVRVAINLSGRQLKRPHFVDDMRARMASCRPLDGFRIELEVTETAIQTDPGIIQSLRELRSMGFRIAIDDFGTGYSSLNSLKQLPIDILKIDRAFVRGIPKDEGDRAITSAIIAMGHSMGMSIIAEGIENEEQLAFLRSRHCDDAQGYYLCRPVPAEECCRILSAAGNHSTRLGVEAAH